MVKGHDSGEFPPKLLFPEVKLKLLLHEVMHSEVEWTVQLPILCTADLVFESRWKLHVACEQVESRTKFSYQVSYGNEHSLRLLVEERAMKSKVCMIKSLSP